MRVILQPLSPADGNSVVVETNSEAVISSLISSYCAQKNVHFGGDFFLHDEKNRPLLLYSTVSSAGIADGETLFIGRRDPPPSVFRQWPIIFAFAALFIGLVGILTISLVYGMKGGEYFDDYGVVMDAGSSKTNTIVYKWKSNKNRGTGCVSQEINCFAPGGIAKMNPMHLEPVIDCAKNITTVIPTAIRSRTPLFFAATAGMRLLNITNPQRVDEILNQLWLRLPETNLDTKVVEIISGRDEGIYGWITVNFLGKTLETPQNLNPWEPTTYGALDMGGASMQISFAIPAKYENASTEYISNLDLYGQTFPVFAQSNLCFGRDEAQNRFEALLLMDHKEISMVIQNPCAPQGYEKNVTAAEVFESICAKPKDISKFKNLPYTYIGTSDPSACLSKVSDLLNSDVCQRFQLTECFKVLDGQETKQKYMAFATFFFTTDFLNVTNSSLGDYEEAVQKYCSYNIIEVKKLTNKSFGLQYCFNGNYILTVLIKGLGFRSNTWRNIEFVKEIAGKDVGWSLGYMINTTNIIPEKTSPRLLTPSALAASLALFIILIVITAIFLLVTCKKEQNNSKIFA